MLILFRHIHQRLLNIVLWITAIVKNSNTHFQQCIMGKLLFQVLPQWTANVIWPKSIMGSKSEALILKCWFVINNLSCFFLLNWTWEASDVDDAHFCFDGSSSRCTTDHSIMLLYYILLVFLCIHCVNTPELFSNSV